MSRHRFADLKQIIKTLLALLIGLGAIIACTIYLVNAYWILSYQLYEKPRLLRDVTHVLAVAEKLSPAEFEKVQPHIIYPGMWVTVRNDYYYHRHAMQKFDFKFIKQQVEQSKQRFRISYEFAPNTWLNISVYIMTWRWIFYHFAFPFIVLLTTIILFCIWITFRFVMPIWHFASAAKRFGSDVQAPPIPEAGPPAIRTAKKAFNDMQSKIRQLIHDRTQMLAAISHDLRTPITRLKLRVEAIPDKDSYHHALADLTEMEHMISSILVFAKASFRSEVAEDFDLRTLLEDLCHEWQDLGKDVTFSNHVARIVYYGRINALKRAFNNLLENAIKYGTKATVSLSVTDDLLKIYIDDQGPGLASDEMERVFMPFYRVDSARSPVTAGSGLGLAITKDIITAHGGSIKLQNLDGAGGLRAIVELPTRG